MTESVYSVFSILYCLLGSSYIVIFSEKYSQLKNKSNCCRTLCSVFGAYGDENNLRPVTDTVEHLILAIPLI